MNLTYRVDDNGQRWQICSHCVEWTKFEDLAIDPEDGLRWDVCQPCMNKKRLWGIKHA